MSLLDPKTIRGILVIGLIIWLFSGAGMRLLQKLLDRLADEL